MNLNLLLLDSLSASIPKLLELQFSVLYQAFNSSKKFLDYLLYTTCYALCITDKQGLLWCLPFGTPNIEELLAQTYGQKLYRLKFMIGRESVNSA